MKRTIDFDKFADWLADQAGRTNKMADDMLKKEMYLDAAGLKEEANVYEFLHDLLYEAPGELPDFVIVEEVDV